MMFSKMNHFQQRIVMSSIAVIIVFTSILLSSTPLFKPVFASLIAIVIGTALWEYFQISRLKGFHPPISLAIFFSAVFVAATFLSTLPAYNEELPLIAGLSTIIGLFAYYFVYDEKPFSNMAVTLFGFVYLVIPLSYLLKVIYFFPNNIPQDGRWWFFYLLFVTKMTDTGAYFFGKTYGKSKLAPYISPKKTWEGSIGGLVVAVAASVLIYLIVHLFFHKPPMFITLWESIWLGVMISAAAQFGDLAESLLKRDGGIKDSNQLPGLGGMLDIVDSIIFTAPLLYIFLKTQ